MEGRRKLLTLLLQVSGTRHALPRANGSDSPLRRYFYSSTHVQSHAQELKSLNSTMRDMLQKHEPHRAVELFSKNLPILSDIAASNPMLVADVYDFALQAFASQGDAEHAERLVSSMWKQKIPVGRVANSSVVKAMCAAGRHADALKYLKSISSQRSDIVGYNILMSECAGEREYLRREIGVRAWNVLKKKMQKGSSMRPDAITWSASIRLHGVNKELCDQVWAEWLSCRHEFSESDRTSVGASYVSALCACGEFDKALEQCKHLLEEIDKHLPEMLEIPSTPGHPAHSQQRGEKSNRHASPVENVRVACNTLLHASVASSNDRLMSNVVKMMTSRGLTPDTITYNALLRRSLRRREGSVAIKEGLDEMQRMGISPDQTSIEILIQSYACQGQIVEAEKAVDVIIKEYNASPCHAWGTLMAACGNSGDAENVSHVFWRSIEYIDAHRNSDKDLCISLIDLCMRALSDSLGRDFWRRILHRDIPLHGHQAKDHGQQHEQDHTRHPENHFHYIEDISMSLLEDIGNLMSQRGIQKTNAFWMYMLECFGSLGRGEDVDSCLKDMGIDIPRIPNEQSMMELIAQHVPRDSRGQKVMTRSHEENSSLLQVMARLGRLDACFGIIDTSDMAISSKDYISLIEGCAQSSPPKEELSRALLRQARESGIPIDTRFYNALILVKARIYGVQGVHEGMDEMKARGISPNVFTYFVLREAAILANDQRTASSALESINSLIQGDARSRAEDGNTSDADIHVPEKMADESHSIHHWKGYYAPSDDDDW